MSKVIFKDHTIIAPNLYHAMGDNGGTGDFSYGVYDKAGKNKIYESRVGVWNVYKNGEKVQTHEGNKELPQVKKQEPNSNLIEQMVNYLKNVLNNYQNK